MSSAGLVQPNSGAQDRFQDLGTTGVLLCGHLPLLASLVQAELQANGRRIILSLKFPYLGIRMRWILG